MRPRPIVGQFASCCLIASAVAAQGSAPANQPSQAVPPAGSAPPAPADAAPAAPSATPPTAPSAAPPKGVNAPGYPDLDLPPARSFDDDGFSPGETPTSTVEELDEIYAPRRSMFDLGAIERPLDDLTALLAEVNSKIGLRFGFAYTMLFQQASGGPGDRNGFAGDIDFMSAWTLIGRETGNTGTFVLDGEYRFAIGEQPPSALGGVLGTLTNTTGGFNDRGWVVRDAHWRQRLFDDHLRLLVGRADSSDYVGGTRMQSINLSFLNRAFSANPSVAFPAGHGPTAGATILPCDWFYVTGGAQNAYSRSNTIEVDSLDQGDFFWFTELGLTPNVPGIGNGRYRVLLWRMDERQELGLPQDQGISVILEQDFGDQFLAFARYGYSDATLTNIQNAVQAGLGYRGLLGSPDNLTGFAAGWGEPPGSGARDETVFEVFQRFQVTHRTQITVGYQLILDPAFNPTQDVLGVFEARFRISF